MINRLRQWRDRLPTLQQRHFINVLGMAICCAFPALATLWVVSYLLTPVGDAAFLSMTMFARAIVVGCIFIGGLAGIFSVSAAIALLLKAPDIWGRR